MKNEINTNEPRKCICGVYLCGDALLCRKHLGEYGSDPTLWPKNIKREYLEINFSKDYEFEIPEKDEGLQKLWEDWPEWLRWQAGDAGHNWHMLKTNH